MISSSASSSVLTRRSSDVSSCCIRSRSLGLVIRPASMRSRSRVRRALTCSTSRVGLALLGGEVVDDDPGVAQPVVDVAATGLQLGDPGDLGQGAPLVAQLVEPRVDAPGGRAASTGLAGSAFNALLGWGSAGWCSMPCSTRNCQGSVHRVLTRVSTLSPSRAGQPGPHHRQPRPLGRPVRDVDQGRPVVLAELRPRGGAAGRWSRRRRRPSRPSLSSRKSPAPPHTATRRTGRSGSPDTRTPWAVSGSTAATLLGEVAQGGRRDGPVRPVPVGPSPGSASSTRSKAGSS